MTRDYRDAAAAVWSEIERTEAALAQAQTYAGREALRERLQSLSAEWRRASMAEETA